MTSLDYAYIDTQAYSKNMCNCGCKPPIFNYLLNYTLPEDLVVAASTSAQYFEASAKNRYIRSVTILPVTTTLDVTPSTSIQTFTAGPYSTVTVQAAQQ